MTGRRLARRVPVIAVAATIAIWSAPAPAAASVSGVVCSLGGLVSGLVGKACDVAAAPGRIVSAGKRLLGGHVGGALSALAGATAKRAAAVVGLAAVGAAVVQGAHYALRETVTLIGATTSPNLRSTWFSAFYWRMAAVAALLTLPFLFAAAIQALIRSDLALLARAAFGYLPLGMLAIGVAAPLTNLLLAGSDEMSAIVASASGHAGASFLLKTFAADAIGKSVFVSLFVGVVTVGAAVGLWVELVIREAAVYVLVLMLPLFFAAMVWPARRVWAARAVELLVALILSKFAIVAVLALGGTALEHATSVGVAATMAGAALVLLAAFTPWALLRILPLHELASAAASGLSAPARGGVEQAGKNAHRSTDVAEDRIAGLAEQIRGAPRPPAPDDRSPVDGVDVPRTSGGDVPRTSGGDVPRTDGGDREAVSTPVATVSAAPEAGTPTPESWATDESVDAEPSDSIAPPRAPVLHLGPRPAGAGWYLDRNGDFEVAPPSPDDRAQPSPPTGPPSDEPDAPSGVEPA